MTIISSGLIGFFRAPPLILKYFLLNTRLDFCVLFTLIIFPINLFAPFLRSTFINLKRRSATFHNLLIKYLSEPAFRSFFAQLEGLSSFRMQLSFRRVFDMIGWSFLFHLSLLRGDSLVQHIGLWSILSIHLGNIF